MLSQAPFEPTYATINFNTMPLFPILIGLGRWVGIEGSFLLKFWPLSALALSASALSILLFKKGLPWIFAVILGSLLPLDPAIRWASVVVRPESFICLCGILLVGGLTYGFPKRFEPKRFWDPVSFLLATAAYLHFNAIHLVLPVLVAFYKNPKRIFLIAAKTTLYLLPWLILVAFYWHEFLTQMVLQWVRFNNPNLWFKNIRSITGLFYQSLGLPEPWDFNIYWMGTIFWLVILIAWVMGFILPWIFKKKNFHHFTPVSAWILAALWLWHSKPEVWFIIYIHVACWLFISILSLKIYQMIQANPIKISFQLLGGILAGFICGIFIFFINVGFRQSIHLKNQITWNWKNFEEYINCIDTELVALEARLNKKEPLTVWGPTFPDILIELSLRHPSWKFTRTDDFWWKKQLAIQHGWDTDAVIVTEIHSHQEAFISKPHHQVPWVYSIWTSWTPYFLYTLKSSPHWKPNRFVCQRGKLLALLFMKDLESPKEEDFSVSKKE